MSLFDRPKRRVRQAAALRRTGDCPAAIDVLADVLAQDPAHVAANAEMARALRVLGDPAGAEEHLRRAIATVLDYQLVVELATALAEQGRTDEAEIYVDAALGMAKGNPRADPGEALLVRAVVAAAEGRDDDARAALDAIPPKRAGSQVKEYAGRLRASLGGSPT